MKELFGPVLYVLLPGELVERRCGVRGSFYRSPRCLSCFVDMLRRMLGRLGCSCASALIERLASHALALSAAEQSKIYQMVVCLVPYLPQTTLVLPTR